MKERIILLIWIYLWLSGSMAIANGNNPNDIPLFGKFEIQVINNTIYENPFMDVELNSVFTSPSGKKVHFFGFYDGDGQGGQKGNVWIQRFMPNEAGTWTYIISFSDGSLIKKGKFNCVQDNAKPGPWQQYSENPHWFTTANGEHFLPLAMYAGCVYSPIDWLDAIQWCKTRNYNTLFTSTMNTWAWPEGQENITAFTTKSLSDKEVNYENFNLRMWKQWDEMIETAGEDGIYIGPFNGPTGFYGGRRSKYPPVELAYYPANRNGWDTPQNIKLIRYLIARQGAYWNIAFWNLGSTEMYHFHTVTSAIRYGQYFASISPFERMITAQDCEQWHNADRRWLSKMNFPSSRKLNTIQTGVGEIGNPDKRAFIDDTTWQQAYPNYELAIDAYNHFPVIATESLWEGQGRAKKPLRIIWGMFMAGAHTMWADWSYESPENHDFGSIGRGWIPLKPSDKHLFQVDQLGVDCVGDEQLKIATNAIQSMQYWKMNPHNELVSGSLEAYCLAEPGAQYMVYIPNGGIIKLNLEQVPGLFELKWLDPLTGNYSKPTALSGEKMQSFILEDGLERVLILQKK